jgi:hypothetical protein
LTKNAKVNTNAKVNQLSLHGTSYLNFINAIKSPATKAVYENSLKRYLNHIKQKGTDDLLVNIGNPRYIESQIIDYIMALRESGVSYATMQFLVAPIFTFYQLNDIVLNRKNSSTGARMGSLPGLTLGNLTKLPDLGLYRIIFYEGTKNEYYTFTTNECASSITSYLLYRQRCGEKISFNEDTQKWEPHDIPLIRIQFDVNDILQVRNPKPMTTSALRMALSSHLVKSGLRQIEHPTATTPNSSKRVRKPISLSNGFRKYVISTFIQAGLNHEIRELICDHSTQLDQNYFRPTQEQVLQEYLKAEPLLTLDPSLRLQNEIQTLRVEKSSWEAMRKELDDIKALLNKG